jgi:ADP-ribose pyrophosphatase YjhB (NUDIX family)
VREFESPLLRQAEALCESMVFFVCYSLRMDYEIEPGVKEADLPEWLKTAAKKWGTFDDNRVNYTDADIAPIVMCTVVCGDAILLVKRGYGHADANGYWSTVNGFIDKIKPVYKQVIQEVKEELNVDIDESMVEVRGSYILKNPREKRSYIVFPCLVSLSGKPNIILDRENTEYVWIKRAKLNEYDILSDLPYAIDSALGV